MTHKVGQRDFQTQTANEYSVFFDLLILDVIFDHRALRIVHTPRFILEIQNVDLEFAIVTWPNVLLEQDKIDSVKIGLVPTYKNQTFVLIELSDRLRY